MLVAGLEFDYAKPGGEAGLSVVSKSERELMRTRVAEDAQRAIAAVKPADGLLELPNVKAA